MHFLDFKSQKLHGLFYLTQYHSDVVRKKIAIWLLINELHFFKMEYTLYSENMY